MKKIYFAFFFLLVLFQFFLTTTKEVSTVSQEVFRDNPIEQNHYYLSFEHETCTSRDLDTYFEDLDVEIERIYPKIQLSIVDDKINQQLFSFSYYDRELLEQQYKKILQNYGLDQDIEKVNRYGVLVSKVKIATDYSTLQQLLTRFPSLQYSHQLEGKYR